MGGESNALVNRPKPLRFFSAGYLEKLAESIAYFQLTRDPALSTERPEIKSCFVAGVGEIALTAVISFVTCAQT